MISSGKESNEMAIGREVLAYLVSAERVACLFSGLEDGISAFSALAREEA